MTNCVKIRTFGKRFLFRWYTRGKVFNPTPHKIEEYKSTYNDAASGGREDIVDIILDLGADDYNLTLSYTAKYIE